jgi:hypothetical protein
MTTKTLNIQEIREIEEQSRTAFWNGNQTPELTRAWERMIDECLEFAHSAPLAFVREAIRQLVNVQVAFSMRIIANMRENGHN